MRSARTVASSIQSELASSMTTSARAAAAEPALSSRTVSTFQGPAPSRRTLLLVVSAVDVIIVAAAFVAATAIRTPDALGDLSRLPGQLVVVSALMVAGLALHEAYELERVANGEDVLTRLGLGALVGLGLVVLASYVVPQIAIGRGVFVLHAALAVPPLLVWRRLLLRTLRRAALRTRAVVLGEAPLARKIARALAAARFGGAEVVGILCPEKGEALPIGAGLGADAYDEPFPRPDDVPVLGTYDRLKDVARRRGIAQVVVVAGATDGDLPVDAILALADDGVVVRDGAAAYEAVTGKILIDKLTPGWLVFANAFERTPLSRAARRAIEAVVAGVALVWLSPFLALVAALVKLDSPGPVFYRQRRVGLCGRIFELTKFRTMREDAERATGPVFAQERDPRVTRIGRLLRRTRVDELPQLLNVLRGDMSFVGPRPERPEFVEVLRREVPHYDQRHSVPPGITGWAQINFRYGATLEDAAEKLQYDLFYIQNMSPLLDLSIVLGTIRVVFGAENKN